MIDGERGESGAEKMFVGFAVFGIVAIGCFVAVMVGVINPPSEPGFFENAPTWQRADLPLVISVGRYNVERTEYRKADLKMVKRVVKAINRQLGRRMYTVDSSAAGDSAGDASRYALDADVTLELGVPWDVGGTGEEGRAEIRQHKGVAVSCDVIVTGTVPWALEPAVVHHELGHCLGLDDDIMSTSIMYPRTTKESVGRLFSPYDIEILRKRYRRTDPVDAGEGALGATSGGFGGTATASAQ